MFVYVVTGWDGGMDTHMVGVWSRKRCHVCVCVCGVGVLFIHIETSGSSYQPLSHDDDVMLVGTRGVCDVVQPNRHTSSNLQTSLNHPLLTPSQKLKLREAKKTAQKMNGFLNEGPAGACSSNPDHHNTSVYCINSCLPNVFTFSSLKDYKKMSTHNK